MADILTGHEEREIAEAVSAYEAAIARLAAEGGQEGAIVALQLAIDASAAVIENEIPTPELCPDCNPREDLPNLHCPRSGHAIGLDGYAIEQPAFLELGEKA